MRPEDPENPKTWVSRARSNLKLAEKGGQIENVHLEDLCFNAQQAAEKALKAVYLARGLDVPRTHSIGRLIDVLETGGIKIPANVKKADILTQYAVETRYSGPVEKVTKAEYREALKLAAKVVFWVESIL